MEGKGERGVKMKEKMGEEGNSEGERGEEEGRGKQARKKWGEREEW